MTELVFIDYTNHRGERRIRLIKPKSLRFGASDWHPEHQWLLTAYDADKEAEREFAMKGVHVWAPVAEGEA